MKTKKTNDEKKPHAPQFSFPCGDFQKMAEMMKNCCPGEGDAIDCCSMMKRMTGRSRGAGGRKTKEAQKQQKGSIKG